MVRPSETLTIARAAADDAEPPSQVELEGGESAPRRDEERYAGRAVLGEGGMGKVLLVRDRYIGRQVALKELKDDARGSTSARARFEREARLQGQLEHPAIVPVYDIGTGADGSPFFTMKLVKGEPLDAVLADASTEGQVRFSQRRLLSAFSQLCVAVQYAHERGVVHRDIKPANIMLGAYGEVYLLDWGVAKVAHDDAPTAAAADDVPARGAPHTGQGSVLGTLSTMAPEQALGGTVDARSDVYALGAVLFHILTGESLHPKGEFDEIVARIVAGVDARPSVRAPQREVAPELEALCVAATRLHPGDRLGSAVALHNGVEAYLDGDRDQELRRASARKHGAAARAAADGILASAPADQSSPEQEELRARALREVGKALALDPGNKQALSTLVDLLTTPPRVVPREVAESELAMARRRIRIGGIACAVVYGYISVNAFTTWQLGVRDVATFVTAHLLWGSAFLAGLVTVWRPSYVPLFVAFLFGIATCVFITTVYSPYLMVPPLLTMHAVLFALVQHWRMRITMVVIASLGWTTSVFGAQVGLLPRTVSYPDGDMLIHSGVIALPERGLTIYLYLAVLAMIVMPALVVGALRSAWLKSDRAMRLQVWQLGRLVAPEQTPAAEAAETAAAK